MKVLSWILTVLSYLSIPVFVLIGYLGSTPEYWAECWYAFLIFGAVFFAFFGLIAHLCIKKRFLDGERGTKFVYYSTFPQFIFLFVIFFIVMCLINLLKRIAGKSNADKGGAEYIVLDGGFERKLTLIEANKTDYAVHGKVYHELVGSRYYNKFIDDLGNYWRSYDNNETFISEHDLTYQGYSFS